MTEGEIAYLSLVLVLFAAFFVVIGFVTATQEHRSDR